MKRIGSSMTKRVCACKSRQPWSSRSGGGGCRSLGLRRQPWRAEQLGGFLASTRPAAGFCGAAFNCARPIWLNVTGVIAHANGADEAAVGRPKSARRARFALPKGGSISARWGRGNLAARWSRASGWTTGNILQARRSKAARQSQWLSSRRPTREGKARKMAPIPFPSSSPARQA